MRVSLFMLLAVMFLTIPHIAGAQSAQERREAQQQAQQERREAQQQARREAQQQARREAQQQARREAQQNRRPTPNNPVNVPEIDAMSGSAALAALGGALLLMRERRRL
jgi:Flp pilus assembly protein TadB